MPSRTYVQMLMKQYKNGNYPMSTEYHSNLKPFSDYLDEHPEIIEELVQYRVRVFKSLLEEFGFITTGPTVIFIEMLFVAYKMNRKLYLYPGGRGQCASLYKTIVTCVCSQLLPKDS